MQNGLNNFEIDEFMSGQIYSRFLWKGMKVMCLLIVDWEPNNLLQNLSPHIVISRKYFSPLSSSFIAGWKGFRCTDDIDECSEYNPCWKGNCRNTRGSYKCVCPPNRSGRLCNNVSRISNKIKRKDKSAQVGAVKALTQLIFLPLTENLTSLRVKPLSR